MDLSATAYQIIVINFHNSNDDDDIDLDVLFCSLVVEAKRFHLHSHTQPIHRFDYTNKHIWCFGLWSIYTYSAPIEVSASAAAAAFLHLHIKYFVAFCHFPCTLCINLRSLFHSVAFFLLELRKIYSHIFRFSGRYEYHFHFIRHLSSRTSQLRPVKLVDEFLNIYPDFEHFFSERLFDFPFVFRINVKNVFWLFISSPCKQGWRTTVDLQHKLQWQLPQATSIRLMCSSYFASVVCVVRTCLWQDEVEEEEGEEVMKNTEGNSAYATTQ